MNRYQVYFDGHPVGEVEVCYEGLYLRFRCSCQIPDRQIYRLRIVCGEQLVDLGILAPCQDRFGLDKRVPIKQFSAKTFQFRLISNKTFKDEKLYPVSEQECFSQLSALDRAKLEYRDGRPHIRILN